MDRVTTAEQGYKIVILRDDGKYESIITTPASKVVYNVGEETFPREGYGPLCVFRTLKDTKYTCFGGPRAEVWTCEFKRSNEKKVWEKDGKYEYETEMLSEGTILADSVTLLNRVGRTVLQGYKVVGLKDGKRVSLYTPSYASVIYNIDKETFSIDGCGPLCVFISLEEALDHSYRLETSIETEIWLCDYTESEEENVWTISEQGRHIVEIDYLPEGTILADSVTLRYRFIGGRWKQDDRWD